MPAPIFLCVLGVVAAVSQANILDTAKASGCAKLVSIIEDAGLTSALANSPCATLFAPSDAAIAAIPADVYSMLSSNRTLLQEVLKFHALPSKTMAADLQNDQLLATFSSGTKLRTNIYNGGKVVTAQGSRVIKADLPASNGVVHVIDRLIYPVPALNLPLVLTFDKDLSSLGYLLYQANLISNFSEQSFTVFAPNNPAIAKIPGQEYNDLLMNFTELTSVLSLHVVRGTVFSAGLTDGQKVKSLQGGTLDIHVSTDGVTVNGAKVLQTDLSATNGVIYVIDTLLFPPKMMTSGKTFMAPINVFECKVHKNKRRVDHVLAVTCLQQPAVTPLGSGMGSCPTLLRSATLSSQLSLHDSNCQCDTPSVLVIKQQRPSSMPTAKLTKGLAITP
ncbi:hypothetical protein RRG08_049332 [Elysia crispata]|uniref:FAS1 domain-containing protein n=1 Tax=Elysia crispata TaxID=231223 RepID=A0AAE1CEG9_9GAST|nr:hypothetical protein RRG08_049332 [Elysia crispata]